MNGFSDLSVAHSFLDDNGRFINEFGEKIDLNGMPCEVYLAQVLAAKSKAYDHKGPFTIICYKGHKFLLG